MNSVGKNIKRLRSEKGITQDQLAERLHVTRQAVSNWGYVIYYAIKY